MWYRVRIYGIKPIETFTSVTLAPAMLTIEHKKRDPKISFFI